MMKPGYYSIAVLLLSVFFAAAGNGCSKSTKGAPVLPATAGIDTASPGGGAPPLYWQERFLDHRQYLTRVAYNDQVAVYYDNNMERTITWPLAFMTDVWKYTKSVYGNFGTENRLYCVFHRRNYSGGRTGNMREMGFDSAKAGEVSVHRIDEHSGHHRCKERP